MLPPPPPRWLHQTLGRAPLFSVSCMVVSTLVIATYRPLAEAWIACSLLTGVLALCRSLPFAACSALAATCTLLSFSHRCQQQELAAQAFHGQCQTQISATLLTDPKGSPHWSAFAEIADGPYAGTLVYWRGKGTAPVAHAKITAIGDFQEPAPPRNPGEFNTAAWLRQMGASAVFNACNSRPTIVTPRWATTAATIKAEFRRRVTLGLDDASQEAQIIRAMVIGEPPQNADEVVHAFRNSGTLHAFSVSGLHVGMVGGLAWSVLSLTRLPRRWAVWLLIPIVFLYSWLTGNSIPALRSAWMAAIFLSAFGLYRRPNLLNSLGAVLLVMLIWDARVLFLPGVQLSYGVVAAIALGTRLPLLSFSWLAKPSLHLPQKLYTPTQTRWLQLRRNLAQSLSASTAACLGSAPLTAYHFGMICPISIFASVILIPLVFAILAAGLLSVALSPIPPLAHAVSWTNGKISLACAFSANALAHIPGAIWHTHNDPTPSLRIFDLERGASAATFSDGMGSSVLIDCADFRQCRTTLVPALDFLNLQPNAIVFTHPDSQHLGGSYPLWKIFPIRYAAIPANAADFPSFRPWRLAADSHSLTCASINANSQLPFPDHASLICPWLAHSSRPHPRADDEIAIYRLHWRSWSFLFTSDAGLTIESAAVMANADLHADVIVADFPNSGTALSDAFIEAVNPRIIILPNGPKKSLPCPTQRAAWLQRGIQIIDLAQTGGLAIHQTPNGSLSIHGYLQSSPLTITHP